MFNGQGRQIRNLFSVRPLDVKEGHVSPWRPPWAHTFGVFILVGGLFYSWWFAGAPGRGLNFLWAWIGIITLIGGVLVGIRGGKLRERIALFRLPHNRPVEDQHDI